MIARIGAGRRPAITLIALTAILGLLTVGLSNPRPAVADTLPPAGVPETVSVDALPTWQVTGVVWNQVVVGNTVYATGNFTKARPSGMWKGGPTEINVGHLIAYDIRTGNRIAGFNHTLNAQGLAVTATPDGSKIFVGGDFTTVDGQARQHVAAFDTATGNLLSSFAPVVNGQIKAMSATNSTLYVGGAFESAGGVARKRLASFAISNGQMSNWAPTADDGYVWSLVVTPDGSKVVAGGQFYTLNGTTVKGMGAVDATTGATRPWAINKIIASYNRGAINSLSTDGTAIYGTGFAFGSGGRFEGTFSADPSDGSINWMIDCLGDTYDAESVGDVVYTVGHVHNCWSIRDFPDTSPRVRWKYGLAFGTEATGTNRGPNPYGWNYNGQPASSLLHWYPDLSIGTATGQYQAGWTVAANSEYVALGGEFPTVNGADQQGLTRYAIKPIAPNKIRPQYETVPARTTPPTTAQELTPGVIKVTFGSAWDKDNESLTYEIFRDRGTANEVLVDTITGTSSFWELPSRSITESSVPGGNHTYQVRVKDGFGNSVLSPVSSVVTSTGAAEDPTAAFTFSTVGLTANFDGSGSAAPGGSVTSYAWNFGDGETGTGVSPSHTYDAPGSYTVTLTVTDNRGGTDPVSHGVTVSDIRAEDDFGRTLGSGWGTADTGGDWTHVGSSSLYTVADGWGTLRMNAGSGPASTLAGIPSTDTDLRLDFQLDKPPTGGGEFVRAFSRGTRDNGYAAKVWVNNTGQIRFYLSRLNAGTETVLASQLLSSEFVAGRTYSIRTQSWGSGTTNLRAKIWQTNLGEPASWNLTTTDNNASLQAAAGVTIAGYLSGTATNAPVTLSIDNVVVRSTGETP